MAKLRPASFKRRKPNPFRKLERKPYCVINGCKIWNKPKVCGHCDRVVINNWARHWKVKHNITKRHQRHERQDLYWQHATEPHWVKPDKHPEKREAA
jgi:hypothetical protein